MTVDIGNPFHQLLEERLVRVKLDDDCGYRKPLHQLLEERLVRVKLDDDCSYREHLHQLLEKQAAHALREVQVIPS